ncbi:RNA polymerase sigma factor RpoD [Mesorhizobium sp. L-8-10]|uniref:sigma-70 family RNA polymerase sigma factor n=1 Tax=Mesorhizobium sp. L-8-10 TaxID=2744523 RepID=UPI001925ACB5|nr:sigma-70 family RNA polymerase sigma factor [Mesorhizobium sp. L-8-10]BCH32288.1 RNA polymerase sigma factor RpoD [Mesorhizobium sp. L-8-10]
MNYPLHPRLGMTGQDITIELENGPGLAAELQEPAAAGDAALREAVGLDEASLEPRLDEVVHGLRETQAPRPAGKGRESGREAVLSRDPVRAYLRDMGASAPLSREEEVALAKRIEAAQNTLVARVCGIPAVVECIAEWIESIREGRLRATDVFELPSARAEETADPDEPGASEGDTAGSLRGTAATTYGEQVSPVEAEPESDLGSLLDRLAVIAGEIAALGQERASANGDDAEVLARLIDLLSSFAEAAALPLRADRVSALMEMVDEGSRALRAVEMKLATLAATAGIGRRQMVDLLAEQKFDLGSPVRGIEHGIVQLREEFAAVERRVGLPHAEFRRAAAEAGRAWRELRAERERMVRSQLPLVVSTARRYQRRTSLELLDLIQEGNLGLMHAVEKYNYRRGVKVSTYAVWWIRQSIARAITDKGRTIRVPVHMAETAGKVLRERRIVQQRDGRDAEAAEIASRTGLSLEHVERALTLVQEPTSLDLPVGEDGDATLGDLIEARDAVNPHEAAEASALRESIALALGELTPREQRILQMRFGIGDSSEHTLEEVGKVFGVTRERIRQIEARALGKLRQARRARALSSFIEP